MGFSDFYYVPYYLEAARLKEEWIGLLNLSCNNSWETTLWNPVTVLQDVLI